MNNIDRDGIVQSDPLHVTRPDTLPFDYESSASRQHFIDTGSYLREGEAITALADDEPRDLPPILAEGEIHDLITEKPGAFELIRRGGVIHVTMTLDQLKLIHLASNGDISGSEAASENVLALTGERLPLLRSDGLAANGDIVPWSARQATHVTYVFAYARGAAEVAGVPEPRPTVRENISDAPKVDGKFFAGQSVEVQLSEGSPDWWRGIYNGTFTPASNGTVQHMVTLLDGREVRRGPFSVRHVDEVAIARATFEERVDRLAGDLYALAGNHARVEWGLLEDEVALKANYRADAREVLQAHPHLCTNHERKHLGLDRDDVRPGGHVSPGLAAMRALSGDAVFTAGLSDEDFDRLAAVIDEAVNEVTA